jgi:glucokinase
MSKVIGLDIGGTKINGIVFDGKTVLKELTIVTPNNLAEFKTNILKLVDFLSAEIEISGLGIGIAGQVNSEIGTVVRSPNMQFIKNLNLVKFFQANGIKNVKIDNDANCFTRHEAVLGLGKNYKNFIALTLGTGVGGGIVINKQIYRGQQNSGAEFGHMVINGQFMEKYFQKARDKRDNKILGKILGQSFASLINIFASQIIILGGGVSTDKTRHFLTPAIQEMKKFLFDKNLKVKIVISKQKKAGAIGAALLVS